MRSAPLSYLGALALGGLLWVATGFWLASYVADNASLQMTSDAFKAVLYVAFASLAATAVIGAWVWFYYGSRPTTLSDMKGARRFWTSALATQVILAVTMLVGLVVLFRAESLTTTGYALLLIAAAVQAPVFFWIVSIIMSPRGVKYIPWGVR